ncbi:FHA domain-containing protein [Actinoplanes subtropicus]|uniref:FHA domain-containing protein n=1 Tax=Actinoplanes subtropicus TaxID=543632 RepID=UPI00068A4DF3|nr:FHA domain-containing protein [Actinoplanes subtropicus]
MTSTLHPARPGTTLNLVVDGREYRLEPGTRWLIGRTRLAHLRLADPLVSRRHAAVHHCADGWRVTDLKSSNGTWRDGERITHTTIGDSPALIRLGGPDGPAFLLMSTPAAEAETPAPEPPGSTADGPSPRVLASHDIAGRMLRIGRARDNPVVLTDLLVSREHACLWPDGEGAFLADLGSDNGTYVNGHRIRRVRLRPGDLIGIGAHQFRFRDGHLDELDTSGPAFAAAGLGVTLPDGRPLVRDVSFSLPPRTMMAIVGPSGAGKSTLLHALSGLEPATSGRVYFGGRDLYRERAELVRRIGFVPQDDILHRVLTVERALEFGARLRFPTDTTDEERAERIREVVAELRLTDRLGTKISRLSGGERKRASTALELLSRPSLLFLDEPTGGLDIDLDREVMEQLRGLADGGRTVVLVTHNLDHLDRCDVILVLTTGGQVAYCGSPAGVFAHFGVSTWADVYAALKTKEPREWATAFAESPSRDPRSFPPPDIPGTPTPDRVAGERGPGRRRFARQSGTLIRRQLAVAAGDRTLLAMLTLLPAVLALLSRGAPDRGGFARIAGNNDAPQLMLTMIIGAALMGLAGTIRELVKERAIYDRECAVGLSPLAYLCSKVLFCTVVAAVQGLALALLAQAGRVRPDDPLVLHAPYLEMAVVVVAMTVVSALMGLLVSAVVREEGQMMPPLVLLSMAQIVASGGVVPVADSAVLSYLSWFFPARWAFAATASTVDLHFLHPELPHDTMWVHSASVWRWDVSGLACLAVVMVGLTYALLRRRQPRPSRGKAGRNRHGG